MSLAGRVALVTGGGRGIGAAVARGLAAAGADVAITYNSGAEAAAAVADEITALGRRSLVLKAAARERGAVADAVRRVAEEFGRLDILVNNAGVYHAIDIAETTEELFDEVVDVNVRAVFTATQAAVPLLPDGGRIITIGSNLADRVPWPGQSLYAMSKSALSGFTRGVARDLGPRRITVNLVQPGSTDTDMNPAGSDHAVGQVAVSALGYYGAPEDIAATVTHLAGDGGRHVTGSVITIDGGQAA
ncbi:SDR family oxidoreductase [Actinokineospora auranticolor]|uniref:3-oxoacyl-[acyl-carrier protein] reductase n=1 Tax=Actinokineospora auranticolor TaxID=155976 RepID=A0A2S6GDE6_9PSEU|nr:SDR family oxidoreductase [Actinokineospora auranticolor]PPK63252.1 3-oxoacyl-[acyl-carrier protein] reductase [Actinokineospora auranticolor]